MGNVLVDFSPKYILSNYFKDLTKVNYYYDYFFKSGLWKKLDNGDLHFKDLIQELESKDTKDKEQLLSFLNTWHQHQWERKEMTRIIKKLAKKNYGIHLCSNAANKIHSYIDEYEFFKLFDSITISADYKISKPDSEIYHIVLEKNHLEAEDCLFIDDLPVNIEAAEEIGIDGYLYNGNELMFEKFLMNLNVL